MMERSGSELWGLLRKTVTCSGSTYARIIVLLWILMGPPKTSGSDNYSRVTAKKCVLKTLQKCCGWVRYKWGAACVGDYLLKEQNAKWHQKNAVKSRFQITAFVRDTGMIVVGLAVVDMQNDQTCGMVAFWDSKYLWCAGVVSNSRWFRTTQLNAFLQVNESTLYSTGELIWDRFNVCIPSWVRVSQIQITLTKEFSKNISWVGTKFGLVMA